MSQQFSQYSSLAMGAATGTAAFLWMLYRINRAERCKRDPEKRI